MRLAVLVICEHASGCGEMAPGEVAGISMPSWSEPDNSMSSDEEPKLEMWGTPKRGYPTTAAINRGAFPSRVAATVAALHLAADIVRGAK